ncbi:MAG: hypothetical protein U0836_13625 [Pirellulales bacterium]
MSKRGPSSLWHSAEVLESRCLLAGDVEPLKDINTHPINLEGFWPLVNMGIWRGCGLFRRWL